MEICVDELRDLLLAALDLRGLTGPDAEFVAADFLDAQLEGNATHGIAKFLLIDSALAERRGRPVLKTRMGATALIDGQRELGQLAARRAAHLATELAHANAVGLVTLCNFARFGRLKPYGRIIATAGFMGLITNTAGPPVVVPYGSSEPVLGTNPICFAFPMADDAIVIDFGTGERVWGEIRKALLQGSPLPGNAFVDINGFPTTDANAAEAVIPFGGHKGYALCLSLELMVGVLTGTAMGRDVTSEYDLGAVFLAVDPTVTALGSQPPNATARLLASIRETKPSLAHGVVRIPGERAQEEREQAITRNVINVDDETMRRIRKMSVSRGGGLASANKTN